MAGVSTLQSLLPRRILLSRASSSAVSDQLPGVHACCIDLVRSSALISEVLDGRRLHSTCEAEDATVGGAGKSRVDFVQLGCLCRLPAATCRYQIVMQQRPCQLCDLLIAAI